MLQPMEVLLLPNVKNNAANIHAQVTLINESVKSNNSRCTAKHFGCCG